MTGLNYPITRPDRGPRLIRALADLAERYDRGVKITARELAISEQSVIELVDLEFKMRRDITPERRAAREAAA